MRYMLLVYLEEHALDEKQREQCYHDSIQLTRDWRSALARAC